MLNQSSVTTGGNAAIAVQATGAGSSVTGDGTAVSTSGDNAVGVQADNAGNVALQNATVTTSGAAASGLLATGANSSVSVIGGTVTTTGANAAAAAVTGGASLTTTADLTANGAGSNALKVSGGNASLTVSILTSPNGASIAATGGTSNVNLFGVEAVVNNGQWLTVGGGSTLNLVSDGSTLQGAALTDPGSTSNVTLRGGTQWTMTGSSNVTNLTNTSSFIQFTPPAGDPTQLSSYKTLTAVNYVGGSGTFGLNTFLGTDGSPSDRLVINGGTATGNSFLRIANTVGAGALTTGNGILVVDAVNGATTASGAFSLSRSVLAGPYRYTLFRSSVDASNPEAWYLRSNLDCLRHPDLPGCGGGGGGDFCANHPDLSICGGGGGGGGGGGDDTPDFRPETSLYAAIPAMALLYGRNLLDTLHERVGEEEDERSRANPENAKVGWARMIGVNGTQQGDSLGVLGGSAGPHFSYNFQALQGGMDVYRHDNPDGSRDQAGAYFAIGGAQGRVAHYDGQIGDSTFAAYTLGGYWTHFGPAGWYIDAITQGTFYDIRSTANQDLPALKTGAQGAAVSIEGGYPFRLGGGYFIEPQAQLVYQNIHINGASDTAAQIRFTDADSLAARIGARFGRTWSIDNGPRTITAWVRPNLWNEFLGNPTTLFSSEAGPVPFHASLGGLWGEINTGVSGQVNAATTLYANASYQSRFDGGGFAYAGKAGVRINW
ncbi:autotransporter outer membrane beta-barrel domain-containing protein [Bradyrhizobium sp. Pa8]|uniref:autotransporter family protein n=1 Tax=Bradyrhizobium sp. Pa8 TaxID=3386552 RepID=UPI00403F8A99